MAIVFRQTHLAVCLQKNERQKNSAFKKECILEAIGLLQGSDQFLNKIKSHNDEKTN